MALKEFKLPDIGEGIAEGEIVSWKVSAGQAVKEEDEFVEVMTDKATVTITVPFTGSIAELKCAEGDVVPVGSVIAVIDAGAAGAAAPAKGRSCSREGRSRAGPAAAAGSRTRCCPGARSRSRHPSGVRAVEAPARCSPLRRPVAALARWASTCRRSRRPGRAAASPTMT